MKALLCKLNSFTNRFFEFLTPLFILVTRVYLAKVFFSSGLTKISSWQSTLFLFKNEYTVPLLSPVIAAYFGTAAELCLPVLIILGFGSHFTVLALFLFNVVATLSYDFLWTADGSAGLTDHLQWGLLLMMLFCTGFGKWSVDNILVRLFCKKTA
jgi:putative oxidoreductase